MGLWGSDTELILRESLGQCLAHSHCSKLARRVCALQFFCMGFISSTNVFVQPLLLLTGFTLSVPHPAKPGQLSK